jgi:amino-acid N-acetyltransferase
LIKVCIDMVREARLEDAQAIQNLICFYSEDDKMLFRTLEEIEEKISDFLVYEKHDEIVGICSLKFGWDKLVEIRSLCVDMRYHRLGIATQMIQSSVKRALLRDDCETAFVLTYAVPLFTRFGFEVVDKMQLPLKVWNDCQDCLHKDNCDETAMTLSLLHLKKQSSTTSAAGLKDSKEALYS